MAYLEHATSKIIRSCLDLRDNAPASIVDNDINASKCLNSLSKTRGNVLEDADIQSQHQQLIGRILSFKIVEDRWLTQGRDDFVPLLQSELRQIAPEASGRSSD